MNVVSAFGNCSIRRQTVATNLHSNSRAIDAALYSRISRCVSSLCCLHLLNLHLNYRKPWRTHSKDQQNFTFDVDLDSTNVLGNDLDETSSGARFSKGTTTCSKWVDQHGWHGITCYLITLYNAAIGLFLVQCGLHFPDCTASFSAIQKCEGKNTSCSCVATRVCDSWTWSCHL